MKNKRFTKQIVIRTQCEGYTGESPGSLLPPLYCNILMHSTYSSSNSTGRTENQKKISPTSSSTSIFHEEKDKPRMRKANPSRKSVDTQWKFFNKKGFPRLTGNPYCTGANEESRTPDLLITNQLLYQLSYDGVMSCRIMISFVFLNSNQHLSTLLESVKSFPSTKQQKT